MSHLLKEKKKLVFKKGIHTINFITENIAEIKCYKN